MDLDRDSSSSSAGLQRSSSCLRHRHGAPWTEEAEADGLAHDDSELVRGELRSATFIDAEWRHAERDDGRLDAGHGGHRALYADVVSARAATTDAQAPTAANQPEVGRAARHRQIRIFTGQHARGRSAVRLEPAVEGAEEPLAQCAGLPLHR